MKNVVTILAFLPSLLMAQTFTDSGSKSHTLDQIGIGISDPGSYQLYTNGNTYNNGVQYFKTVSYNGDNSLMHLAFPVATDGFYIHTEQLTADKMNVLFRLRDNTTGDYFKIWFDDYRGALYDRYPLQVAGDRVLLAADGGNVGIGITSPAQKLHVSSATSGDAILRLEADTDNNNEKDNARIEMFQDGGLIYAHLGFNEDTDTGGNIFQFAMGSPDGFLRSALTINPYNANVGMGVLNPSEKLDVNGTIRSKEIKVEAEAWPDYVFEPDYTLMTLQNLEAYIKAHHHLPEIPEANLIEENGVPVGELIKTLVKKIEELTLYTIHQQKEIDQLKKNLTHE